MPDRFCGLGVDDGLRRVITWSAHDASSGISARAAEEQAGNSSNRRWAAAEKLGRDEIPVENIASFQTEALLQVSRREDLSMKN